MVIYNCDILLCLEFHRVDCSWAAPNWRVPEVPLFGCLGEHLDEILRLDAMMSVENVVWVNFLLRPQSPEQFRVLSPLWYFDTKELLLLLSSLLLPPLGSLLCYFLLYIVNVHDQKVTVFRPGACRLVHLSFHSPGEGDEGGHAGPLVQPIPGHEQKPRINQNPETPDKLWHNFWILGGWDWDLICGKLKGHPVELVGQTRIFGNVDKNYLKNISFWVKKSVRRLNDFGMKVPACKHAAAVFTPAWVHI